MPQRFSETLDGEFAGRVPARKWLGREASARADHHDAAATLLPVVRQHGADGSHRAKEIGVEHMLCFVNRGLFQRPAQPIGGIVDQRIDVAATRKRGLDKRRDRLIRAARRAAAR